MITLRWSLYAPTYKKIDLLVHSIRSFRTFLKDYCYVVTTPKPESSLLDPIRSLANVLPEKGYFSTIGIVKGGPALFRKWAPFRVSKDIEIHLDYDVLCINYPTIFDTFINGPYNLLLQSRTEGDLTDRTGYGSYANQIDPRLPPCCVGLLGSKPSLNFDEQKLIPHYWNSIKTDAGWFCEQGALIKELEQQILLPTTLLATEPHIRYAHPRYYPLQTNTTMLHLISSERSNYAMFDTIKPTLNFADQ